MGFARTVLLKASRSQWLARQLRERRFFQKAARRFMPGETLDDALEAAAQIGKAGLGSVLTELGEQVTNRAEAAGVAFPTKRDVDESYRQLAQRLLAEAARQRGKPVFGTHDLGLIEWIRKAAADKRVDPSSYEFHMLYGIRAAEQRKLASTGAEVRELIS